MADIPRDDNILAAAAHLPSRLQTRQSSSDPELLQALMLRGPIGHQLRSPLAMRPQAPKLYLWILPIGSVASLQQGLLTLDARSWLHRLIMRRCYLSWGVSGSDQATRKHIRRTDAMRSALVTDFGQYD